MAFSKLSKLLAAGAIAVVSTGAVLAHDGRGGWWGNWGFGHMMHGRGGGGHMMMDQGGGHWMDGRIDGRLAFLKAELKITEAQTKPWEHLAETLRTTTEAHRDMMRSRMDERHSGEFFKKPLPERLAYQQAHLKARLEQVKSVAEAVDQLYAVLDKSQKKVADEIVLPMMGMGGGMMMH